ncbi:MAG: nucleoside-diphosphate sugar epimerase/dehydratase [Kofleriaceae bacterium]
MSRYLTRGLQVIGDLLTLSIAYWLAFLFRFEFRLPGVAGHMALLSWPYVIALEYAVLTALGVPRFSWRYVSLREMQRIAAAIVVATAVLVGLRLGLGGSQGLAGSFAIPLGVLAMNAVMAFVGLVAARALRRLQGEAQERRRRAAGGVRTRVLLVGAGEAGVLVARELASRPDLGLDAVGFVDDDRQKHGTQIAGLTVLGATADVEEIAARKRVRRVLITIASAPGPELRRITLQCREAGLDTKIIPGVYEIVGDRVNLSRIRDVAIEDLLGREQVELDEAEVGGSIRARVVVVTGAGGSIGSELSRQVARFTPSRLVLVERFENALFEIHRELAASFPEVLIEPCVGDVGDAVRMERVFARFRPDVVFHAAAHKHVPMMEANPGEAIKNNVGGTRTVADLAERFGASQFVMISTDKAVNPSSVMGATKRVAELYTQSRARGRTRFVTVRFGNVLGSNGSVIPIFKEQIARGGPVTVTHPEMCRYFMTIPEAAQLVLQAGAMGAGGEVFILDMGKPVKIVDLANDLIRLSGLEPGVDVDVTFSGVRPGEKLFEELATDAERADKTKHPKIFIGRVRAPAEAAALEHEVERLLEAADGSDAAALRAALAQLVPEYAPAPVGAERAAAAPDDAQTTRIPRVEVEESLGRAGVAPRSVTADPAPAG